MFKSEAKCIIDDWESLRACKDLLHKNIQEIEDTDVEGIQSPQQNTKLQLIASAAIANELEKISTREVKAWARYTIFMVEYYFSQFEGQGWCQDTADKLKIELESIIDSIPIFEIECKWQRLGPLANSHRVWTELQKDKGKMLEKIKISDEFELSHPMGHGSSSCSTRGSCWGLTLISKDMNCRLMNGRKALIKAHGELDEPKNGYVTFGGSHVLIAEFETMSVSYRHRALISTIYLINARNRNIPPKYLVNPAPKLCVKKIGTILLQYSGLTGFQTSGDGTTTLTLEA